VVHNQAQNFLGQRQKKEERIGKKEMKVAHPWKDVPRAQYRKITVCESGTVGPKRWADVVFCG